MMFLLPMDFSALADLLKILGKDIVKLPIL
jgi:hypothetical protein